MTKAGLVLVLILALLFESCSSNRSVVGNGILQKRKYRKGFFTNINLKRDQAQSQTALYPSISSDQSKSIRIKEELDSGEEFSIIEAKPISRATTSAIPQSIESDQTIQSEIPEIIESEKETVQNEKKEDDRRLKRSKTRLLLSGSNLLLFSILIPTLVFGFHFSIALVFLVVILPWFISFFSTVFSFVEFIRCRSKAKSIDDNLLKAIDNYALFSGILTLPLIIATGFFAFAAMLGMFVAVLSSFGDVPLEDGDVIGLTVFLICSVLFTISGALFGFLSISGFSFQIARYKKSDKAKIGFWLNILSLAIAMFPFILLALLFII